MKKILVHICCSVDSHFFLQELRKLHKEDEIVGFFYNPNIHPYSEYYLRYIDVQRSCNSLGIELIEGEYDYINWIKAVRGLENELERGKRCLVCFDNRLEVSAKEAYKRGFDYVTTTLLTSPKKSIEQLLKVSNSLKKNFGVEFLGYDFRVNGGTNRQFALAKEDKLYHQDYCGCMFGLIKQRTSQEKLLDELMSPINGQILPKSIQSRVKLYQTRMNLEKEGKDYKIVREKFLNYRLLKGFIKANKEVIPSYILAYSFLKRKQTSGKIAFKIDNLYYLNREEIKFLSLKEFNNLTRNDYKNVKELIFNPLLFEEEVDLRIKLLGNFSISPIIILDKLDKIENVKYEIYIDSVIYDDVKEVLKIVL